MRWSACQGYTSSYFSSPGAHVRRGAVLCVTKQGLSSVLRLRYLVVDDDVQRATSRVACKRRLHEVRSEERPAEASWLARRQLQRVGARAERAWHIGELQRLGHNAQAGESGVAMDKQPRHARPGGVISQPRLLRAHHAQHHGPDALQVGGVWGYADAQARRPLALPSLHTQTFPSAVSSRHLMLPHAGQHPASRVPAYPHTASAQMSGNTLSEQGVLQGTVSSRPVRTGGYSRVAERPK